MNASSPLPVPLPSCLRMQAFFSGLAFEVSPSYTRLVLFSLPPVVPLWFCRRIMRTFFTSPSRSTFLEESLVWKKMSSGVVQVFPSPLVDFVDNC